MIDASKRATRTGRVASFRGSSMAAICSKPSAACNAKLRSSRTLPGQGGAGNGNRTRVFSLEGCCTTIVLYPHITDFPVIMRAAGSLCRRHAGRLPQRPAPGQHKRATRAALRAPVGLDRLLSRGVVRASSSIRSECSAAGPDLLTVDHIVVAIVNRGCAQRPGVGALDGSIARNAWRRSAPLAISGRYRSFCCADPCPQDRAHHIHLGAAGTAVAAFGMDRLEDRRGCRRPQSRAAIFPPEEHREISAVVGIAQMSVRAEHRGGGIARAQAPVKPLARDANRRAESSKVAAQRRMRPGSMRSARRSLPSDPGAPVAHSILPLMPAWRRRSPVLPSPRLSSERHGKFTIGLAMSQDNIA
jgi:hypothetical protein